LGLHNENAGRESLLDIARNESTMPEGNRALFVDGGQKYEYMASANTEDGGHPNWEARKRAAEQMLMILAQPARESLKD
jgi:hypothetical protein